MLKVKLHGVDVGFQRAGEGPPLLFLHGLLSDALSTASGMRRLAGPGRHIRGWKGSLPEAVCAERLAACLNQSTLPPEKFIASWLPGLLTNDTPADLADERRGARILPGCALARLVESPPS